MGDATTGANDGTSGAAATISLQSALWAAQPIDRSGVAAGPCRPDVGRAALADEVELGGGFARCNAIPLSFTP